MTSHLLDSKIRGLQAQGSVGSSLVPATAIAALLTLSTHPSLPSSKLPGVFQYQAGRTQESARARVASEIFEQDILREFFRVYDYLSTSPTALEPEFEEILYENLWDLYT